MSKLAIDQKNIEAFFCDKNADFLIPDYQRPYAWEDKECQKLWDDIFCFAFPDNDCGKFNKSDEYFLGPIVTFKNHQNRQEIIDGQQRLTTLMLLLRAFYSKFNNMKDANSVATRQTIAKCIWQTNEFGSDPDFSQPKLHSEVATDNDKDELYIIMEKGEISSAAKSNYARNFRFFNDQISRFLNEFPSYFPHFPNRILKNCILLPIEAESQNTALRIFSTLNDRGKPLSDADIFKAQFYRYFSSKGEKDAFIFRWKKLEDRCGRIFHPISGTAMDEIFTRYMYFERAKLEIKHSTTEALRSFYEKNEYALLQSEQTLSNLENLAEFWDDVDAQNEERFSDRILRKLFVLNYAPNSMWTNFVSVYYMAQKNANNALDEEKFSSFLDLTIAFIWAYAVVNPGVNQLRSPIYAEMVNVVKGLDVNFNGYLFEREAIKKCFNNYTFSNSRAITKSMLAWWAFTNLDQELIKLETVLEIEHIFSKNRQENEKTLIDAKNLDVLGNKALLEKHINIRASDYKFIDKVKYYKGFSTVSGKCKEGTKNSELRILADSYNNFTEDDIIKRNELIIGEFVKYLEDNKLIK